MRSSPPTISISPARLLARPLARARARAAVQARRLVPRLWHPPVLLLQQTPVESIIRLTVVRPLVWESAWVLGVLCF